MGGKDSKPIKKTAGEPHRGILAHTLEGHKDSILCCKFSPDGKYLASCSSDKTIIIWDTQKMRVLHNIKGHKSEVTAVSFSPDSSTLLSCGKDSKVNLWNVKKGERVYASHLYQFGSFMHCSFSLDSNKLFATASQTDIATLWEIRPDQKVKKKILDGGHRGIVFQVIFSPDNIHLASSGNDKKIILWNRSSGRIIAKLKDKYNSIINCAYNNDGTLISAVVEGERVKVWSTITNEIVFVLEGHHIQPVTGCTFSPDGGIIATVSGDRTYALWDISEPGSPVYHAKAHDNWIQAVSFSPDGIYLATAGNDHIIHIWV